MSTLDKLRVALAASTFEHRTLAVVHRWYSGYEAEHRNREYHGELVTEEFVLDRAPESGLPDVKGRQAYLDSFATAFQGQRNAHHLRDITIEPGGRVVVTHDFETVGPSMAGAATIRYDVELVQDPAERLPKISTFREQVLGKREAPFTDAYAENRVRAFVHYWLSLLEQPAQNAEPLRELIGDDLAMTLSDGRVLHTFDEVSAWYAGAGEFVDISTHHLLDPVITPGEDGNHRITMDFGWEGIHRSGSPMIAHTRHDWTLRETGERYLRLQSFAVTPVVPFTPATADEALDHFNSHLSAQQL